MSSIPPPLPGPTPVDGTKALVDAAIAFAFNPKDPVDAIQIRTDSDMFDKMFKQNYYLQDPKQIAISTITAYLKRKTKKSGGAKKTHKRALSIHKTRKHRKM